MIRLLALLFGALIDYDSTNRKIRKLDMQHNSIKSDKWKREHGLL